MTDKATGLLGNWNRLKAPRVGIMLHYDASASDKGAVQWLVSDSRCKVSYNWLVLDDGLVVIVAPHNARAWHAGVCKPSDPERLPYKDANSAFYGISIAATTGEKATPAQAEAVAGLCAALMDKHGWTDTWRITSHHMEAWPRGRKADVGDVMPVEVIRLRAMEILLQEARKQ